MATSSVLVASFGRPRALCRCLRSLGQQETLPGEVIVVWQGEDCATRDAAERLRRGVPYKLRTVHSIATGIVPAENAGLAVSTGEIVLLIDDDAVATSRWVGGHLQHYKDPHIGAVGSSYSNHDGEGFARPKRAPKRIGELSWFGRFIGNLFDLAQEMTSRPPIEVDHVAAGNMSLRRTAFHHFEEGLKPYWQLFEADACLQAKRRGYKVMFDFSNPVDHYPTNTCFVNNREGDLSVKVFHWAYNHAFVLAKHSSLVLRAPRFLFLLLVGSAAQPGFAGFFAACRRYGKPKREFWILMKTLQAHLAGWREGARVKRSGELPMTGVPKVCRG